jgi:hypothetical protein
MSRPTPNATAATQNSGPTQLPNPQDLLQVCTYMTFILEQRYKILPRSTAPVDNTTATTTKAAATTISR